MPSDRVVDSRNSVYISSVRIEHDTTTGTVNDPMTGLPHGEPVQCPDILGGFSWDASAAVEAAPPTGAPLAGLPSREAPVQRPDVLGGFSWDTSAAVEAGVPSREASVQPPDVLGGFSWDASAAVEAVPYPVIHRRFSGSVPVSRQRPARARRDLTERRDLQPAVPTPSAHSPGSMVPLQYSQDPTPVNPIFDDFGRVIDEVTAIGVLTDLIMDALMPYLPPKSHS